MEQLADKTDVSIVFIYQSIYLSVHLSISIRLSIYVRIMYLSSVCLQFLGDGAVGRQDGRQEQSGQDLGQEDCRRLQ